MAAELAALLRPGLVSFADADRLAACSDLWPRQLLRMHLRRPFTLPTAVVWPETVEDVQALCTFSQRRQVQLVPYGAGSGVVGGAAPQAHQVVVDLKRMRRLREIDAPGRTATAEAGIMGELLDRRLRRAGFTQGHFPSSIYCSTLGGWLAARSAGQMSSRYGKIEDQVLGGLVVLPDGTAVRQAVAPVCVPPLSTLVGSEGTMGFWVEATVRIHPLAEARAWRAFDFPSLETALQAARRWLMGGVAPSVLRIYDPLDSWLHSGTHKEHPRGDRGPSFSAALGAHLPRTVSFVGDRLGGGKCRCILGLEGSSAAVGADLRHVTEVAQSLHAEDLGEQPALHWYKKRYAVSYRMSNVFRAGVGADTMEVACTWDRLIPTYDAVRRAALASGTQVLAHFSHVYLEGGSIYFTFAFPAIAGEGLYDRMWDNVLAAAIGAGANVSHHHGVGQLKAAALQRTMGDGGATLQSVRRRFDPDGRFNPQSLRMPSHGTLPPVPYVPVEPPVTGSYVVAVSPEETLGAVEAHLLRAGKTLGPVSALFGHLTVHAAARAHWLWRVNPQLHTVESVVQGVDARGPHGSYHAGVSPRGAQGPDLVEAALAQQPTRLWLRCADALSHMLQFETDAISALKWAQALAQHPDGRMLRVMLQGQGDAAQLFVQVPEGPRSDVALQLVQHVVGEPGRRCDHVPWTPWPQAPHWLAAPWSKLIVQLTGAQRWTLPWLDPVGGVALVDSAPLPLCEGGAPGPTPSPVGSASLGGEAPAWDGRLRLASAHNPLANCTYCPKLCRFSCPVAVADGSETLTPRQLMLTANLDRTGRRPLSQDAAKRLYSCVDCGGCRSFCEHDNDVATVLQQARAELWDGRAAPRAVGHVVEAYRQAGRLPGQPGPPTLPEGAPSSARTCLWLGCQNDSSTRNAMRGALAMAQHYTGHVHVRSAGCCGHPLWRWGAKEDFRRHAQRQMRGVPEHVTTLLVDDPGCAYAVGHLYPQVGVKVPKVQWVGELVDAEDCTHVRGSWAPHDGCFAQQLHAPGLRQVLPDKALAPAGSVLEGQAGCCGGMLLPYYDATLAGRVARDRSADLLGGGASRILSASPTCSRRLRAVGAPVDDWLAMWGRPEAKKGQATPYQTLPGPLKA